ncbi:MAG: hypothetical protein KC877_03065 [Candidatus Kaiserbacteria bacterium]|nr:hypothetical protein [Candidatus Kaiserbacteria bacterium]MCB9816700.1 hypothetical protein [Candidatus Nomurabacteria bacterium]
METQNTNVVESETEKSSEEAGLLTEAVEETKSVGWVAKAYVALVATLTGVATYYFGPVGLITLLLMGLMSRIDAGDPMSMAIDKWVYKLIVSTVTLLLVSVYGFWFLPLLLLLGGRKLLGWVATLQGQFWKLVLIAIAYKPFPIGLANKLASRKSVEEVLFGSPADAKSFLRSDAWNTTKEMYDTLMPEQQGDQSTWANVLSYVIVLGVIVPGTIWAADYHWDHVLKFYDLLSEFVSGTLSGIGGAVLAIGSGHILDLFGETWNLLKVVATTISAFIGLIIFDFTINIFLHLMILIGAERLYSKSESFRNWVHRTFNQVKELFKKSKGGIVTFLRRQPRLVQGALIAMSGPAVLVVAMVIWLWQVARLFVLKKLAIVLMKQPVLKARKSERLRNFLSKQRENLLARIKGESSTKEDVVELSPDMPAHREAENSSVSK